MTAAIAFEHFDHAVRPQTDLFRHVNGTWLRSAPIAPDRSSAGGFVDLVEQAEKDVLTLVSELPQGDVTTDEGKVAALYAAFMDVERVESLGAAPLAPVFASIDAIDTPAAMARHLGWSLRHGLSPLVHLYEESDPGDPTRYAVFTSQGGLGLPDEAYYRQDEHAEIREQYLAHVTRVLALAGFDDAAAQAQRGAGPGDRDRRPPLGPRALPRPPRDVQPHRLRRHGRGVPRLRLGGLHRRCRDPRREACRGDPRPAVVP